MTNSIDTLKLKELLGSIQVRIDNIDDHLDSTSPVKNEVKEIKESFIDAYKLIDSNMDSGNVDEFPKGGKSL